MGHSRTVVLVDTNEIVRRGLCSLLHSEPGLRVIAEAATAGDGMAHVTRFVPDVLVMDPVTLPDAGGFDMCRRIRAQVPGVRVVMLVERADERAVVPSVRAGATGIVSKCASLPEIRRVILAAAVGVPALDAPATAALFEHLRRRGAGPDEVDDLTDLQQRVLTRVVAGRTNKEIARELTLSEKVVKTCLSRIFTRLHVGRRAQAAVLFAANGSDRDGATAASAGASGARR